MEIGLKSPTRSPEDPVLLLLTLAFFARPQQRRTANDQRQSTETESNHSPRLKVEVLANDLNPTASRHENAEGNYSPPNDQVISAILGLERIHYHLCM